MKDNTNGSHPSIESAAFRISCGVMIAASVITLGALIWLLVTR